MLAWIIAISLIILILVGNLLYAFIRNKGWSKIRQFRTLPVDEDIEFINPVQHVQAMHPNVQIKYYKNDSPFEQLAPNQIEFITYLNPNASDDEFIRFQNQIDADLLSKYANRQPLGKWRFQDNFETSSSDEFLNKFAQMISGSDMIELDYLVG